MRPSATSLRIGSASAPVVEPIPLLICSMRNPGFLFTYATNDSDSCARSSCVRFSCVPVRRIGRPDSLTDRASLLEVTSSACRRLSVALRCAMCATSWTKLFTMRRSSFCNLVINVLCDKGRCVGSGRSIAVLVSEVPTCSSIGCATDVSAIGRDSSITPPIGPIRPVAEPSHRSTCRATHAVP